jgi:translocation and assembly module TamB
MARRVGLALGVALGLVFLVIIAAFGFAQTSAGQRLLAAQLERALAGPGTRVEAIRLEGLIPFDLRLARLTLADAEGVWLELEELRLSWSPAALLQARLEIDEVRAERLELARLPAAAPEEVEDEPFRLPELPERLPPVVLERLAVDRIELGPAVLGEPATFTLSGQLAAGDDGRSAVLALAAERLDEPTARASLDARLDLDPAALELALSAEDAGGLLAGVTGRPEAGEFALKLSGAGPLDGWTGTLELEAERLAGAEARLEIALAAQPRVRLDGSVRPDPALLPADLAGLVGERLGLALTVTQTAAQQLRIEDLRAEIAAAELAGRAEIDFEREQFSAEAGLQMPDLAPLGPLVETPLSGALTADLVAEGSFLRPEGQLELALSAPGVADLAAERIASTLRFVMLEPPDSDRLALQISGAGRAENLRLPGEVPLPAQDLAWRLDLTAAEDGPVTVRELALSGRDLELQVTGSLAPTTLAGQAEIGLRVNDLGSLTEPFGQRVEGKVSLAADLRRAEGAEPIAIDLRGRALDLAGLPPSAAELLGSAPRLTARAVLRPEERLELESLTVEGAAATLGGELALTLPDQALEGLLTLTLPRLEVLASTLGQELAGALELEASPGGTLDAPTVELRVRGDEMLLAGRQIETLTLRASARDLLAAPEGQLDAALETAGIEAGLRTDYRMRDGTLNLAGLRLTGPRTEVAGDLAIDLERTLIDGELRGEVAELAAFAPLLPVPLGGQVSFGARLDSADWTQTVALTANGSELRGDSGQLRRLDLQATVADAFGAPGIEGELELADFRQDQVALDQVALTADGTLEELALTLAAEGEALQPLTLDGRAGLALGDTIRLRLEQLDGRFADEPLRLAQPAELSLADGAVRLAELDLTLGDAHLQASADLGAGEVAADASLEELPLGLLRRFGGPAVVGRASARLQLSGPADNPRGSLDLSVNRLRADNLAFAELPPAELTGRAELADRRLSIDLQGQGVTEKPLTLTAELPVTAQFDPFLFEVPEEGQLAGRLDAELALTPLAALAGLDDQTLSGLLTARVAASGTVGAPRVEGDLEVTDGAYANGTTGTVLHELTLVARADERRIVIERFAAADGGNGSLRGEGEIVVDPAADYPVSLRLEMTEARLVRRDDVDATLSGDLELTGKVDAMSLAGELTVERAEVRIPDKIGPQVAVIEVEEIGADGRTRTADGSSEGSFALAQDLTVDLPGRVFVRGRGLESEWQGRLQVTGSPDEPRVVGTLEVRRGYVDFLDERFELRSGVISFGGAVPPDPTVSIEAVAEKGDLTAIVRIEGRALDPTLTLDSEPPLPQDEILARLLFDRDASQITPAQAAQLALALNRLRGGGGFDIMGKARALLGVDTLDVGGGESPGDGTVRAGKYLNEDVYIEVERGMAGESGRAKVEVEILPNVSLEAETGQDAQSGVGIQWRYDY